MLISLIVRYNPCIHKGCISSIQSLPQRVDELLQERKMAIPTQPFGRSSHMSTRTLFGAASLSHVTQEEADRTLEVLLQYGVNHIDVAASYGDAELRIAPWLQQYRDQFYLATKTGMRTAKEAKEELHRSLERMHVDYVDLWQLHNLVDPI